MKVTLRMVSSRQLSHGRGKQPRATGAGPSRAKARGTRAAPHFQLVMVLEASQWSFIRGFGGGESPGAGVRHTDLDLAQRLTLSGTLHKLFNLCELHLPQL